MISVENANGQCKAFTQYDIQRGTDREVTLTFVSTDIRFSPICKSIPSCNLQKYEKNSECRPT